MGQKKIIGYMRVSTKEQKEDRQKTALMEMGVPEKHKEKIKNLTTIKYLKGEKE